MLGDAGPGLCQGWLSAQLGDPTVGPTQLEGRGIPTLVRCPGDVVCASGSVLSPVESLGALQEGAEPPGSVPVTGVEFGRGVMLGSGDQH